MHNLPLLEAEKPELLFHHIKIYSSAMKVFVTSFFFTFSIKTKKNPPLPFIEVKQLLIFKHKRKFVNRSFWTFEALLYSLNPKLFWIQWLSMFCAAVKINMVYFSLLSFSNLWKKTWSDSKSTRACMGLVYLFCESWSRLWNWKVLFCL